jgi:hypothetical protein
MDEHVMLVGLGEGSFAAEGGRAADLVQPDTDIKVAVPLMPGDEPNFVTGLALDYSNAVGGGEGVGAAKGGAGSGRAPRPAPAATAATLWQATPAPRAAVPVPMSANPPRRLVPPSSSPRLQEPLEHPRDPEKNLPPVPGSAVLLLATVDGALRLYRLANFQKRDGLARVPEPLPVGTAPWIAQAVAAAKKGAAEEEVRPRARLGGPAGGPRDALPSCSRPSPLNPYPMFTPLPPLPGV